MNDRSRMSSRQISKVTRSAISLLESGSGVTLSDKRSGQMIEKYGQEVVPANLSARQAKEQGLLTSGTSGPHSIISSKSAILGQSLANRLQAKTDLLGSTLFKLIWKQRTTPSGRLIPALRASVLRTSAKDFTGWPTPNTPSGGPNTKSSKKHTGGMDLDGAVTLASWPTPMAGSKGTETYNDAGNTDSSRKTVALVAPWSTPIANKWGFPDAHGSHEGPQVSGANVTGFPASTEKPGQLNPAHSRWLMGLPIAWDFCGATVIRLSRRKHKLS